MTPQEPAVGQATTLNIFALASLTAIAYDIALYEISLMNSGFLAIKRAASPPDILDWVRFKLRNPSLIEALKISKRCLISLVISFSLRSYCSNSVRITTSPKDRLCSSLSRIISAIVS